MIEAPNSILTYFTFVFDATINHIAHSNSNHFKLKHGNGKATVILCERDGDFLLLLLRCRTTRIRMN